MNYLKLFKRYSWLNFLTLVEYRTSFFLGVISGLTYLLINLLFWSVIYSHTTQINGWSFAQIILVQGFFSLFMGLFWVLFHFSEVIDRLVIHGDLDKYLSRPINILAVYMFDKMDWLALMDVLDSIVYFVIAAKLGIRIGMIEFLIAFLVLFLGMVIIMLIMLTISCLSFWIGRANAINAIWFQLWNMGDYPVTIYPFKIQFLLTFALPLIFLQTYPAMIISNQLTSQFILKTIAIELVMIITWFAIAIFTWRKGLKRYASYGG